VDTQKLKTNFESNISENKIENYSVKAPILVKENFKPDSKIRVENLPALKKAKKIDANNLNYKNMSKKIFINNLNTFVSK